jgi:hypothetical protein
MDGKTTIAVEIRYENGEITEFQLSRNAWDLNGEDVGELFRQLMSAMGFAESTIASVFNDDQDLYAEAFDEDEARLEPCCCTDDRPEPVEFHSETLRSVFEAMDAQECNQYDPCHGCDEACEDTACLHAVPEDWHDGDGDNE